VDLPASQAKQLVMLLPAELTEYVPATQLMHTACTAPISVEYEPAAHAMHTPLPLPILYFPAIHSSHTPPSGPLQPALHVHKFEVAPVAVICAPVSQLVHRASPASIL